MLDATGFQGWVMPALICSSVPFGLKDGDSDESRGVLDRVSLPLVEPEQIDGLWMGVVHGEHLFEQAESLGFVA